MLLNFKSFCCNLIIEFKCFCRQYKFIIISLGIIIFIGMIISFQNPSSLQDKVYNGNIIVIIKGKNFNFFIYLLKNLIFFAIIYIVLIFSKFHFGFFCCNGLLLVFYIKRVFTTLYMTFLFDGFYAYLFFIFYWLPLFVFSVLCYFYVLCKIYSMLGYDKCKGRPLCCPSGNLYTNLLIKCFLINFIPFIIYNIIFVIIFNIIF